MLRDTVEKAQGSEDHFATDEAVVDKFRQLATKSLSPRQAEALADRVLHIDEVEDASELARLLVPDPSL